MPHIELNETIGGSFYSVSPAAWQLALDLSQRHAPYEDLALSVELQKFGLPDVGNVQVSVYVEVGEAFGIPPSEFGFAVGGAKTNVLFPRLADATVMHEVAGAF